MNKTNKVGIIILALISDIFGGGLCYSFLGSQQAIAKYDFDELVKAKKIGSFLRNLFQKVS